MKDNRINKIKQHFDIFFNDQKFKVISCTIKKNIGRLSIKTKIFGQHFPNNGRFIISIPSQNFIQDLSITFLSKYKDTSIENWEYTINSNTSM